MSEMSNSGNQDEPFLARWSRRKQDARNDPVQARPEDAQPEPAPAGDGAAAQPGGAGDEPELDLSKLPKVDELTVESDITVFLDKRVPQMLRNAALGRMWALDPTIRDFIEVAENQWNWNVPGATPFYEEILSAPGELSQVVAQAGSEAGKLLADPARAAGTGLSQAAVPPDIRLKDDPARNDSDAFRSAVHNEPSTADSWCEDESASESTILADVSSDAAADVAMQQTQQLPGSLRKRHGGALPS